MRHSVKMPAVVFAGTVTLSELACGSGTCDQIGCGPAITVRFEPPIAITGEQLKVEINRDGAPFVCTAKETDVTCEPGNTPNGQVLEGLLEKEGGLLVRVRVVRSAKELRIRVLRGDAVQREGTFTPEYREHRLNECTTCRFTEVVMNEPD